MHIVLVPPIPSPVFSEDKDYFMPLGLLALISSVEQAGYCASLYEPSRTLWNTSDFDSVASEILEIDSDIIGFSTWCNSYPTSLLLAEAIKEKDKDKVILFGGPQATLLKSKTLKTFSQVDYILSGESDESLPKFLQALCRIPLDLTNIPGLAYRRNGVYAENESAPAITNLDSLPFPAYDRIDLSGSASIDVGRGCPFKCTFCSTKDFFSRKFRTKSVDRIIDEMDNLYESNEVTSFNFTHDMFTLKKDFIIHFCNRLIEKEYQDERQYRWTCSARIDCIDKDLIKHMVAAGCCGIFFGIESGSQRIQKLIKKNLKLDRGYEIINHCRNLGLPCSAAFILGFPFETREDIQLTLSAIARFALIGAKVQISLLSLLPQTELYDEYKDNLELDSHYSDFTRSPSGRYERQLISKHPDIFSSFYHARTESVARPTLIALNEIINMLPCFYATFNVMKDLLYEIVDQINLLDLMESKIESDHPRINILIDGLSSLIFNQHEQIPEYAFDVFTAETAALIVCKKFVTQQILEPRKQYRAFISTNGTKYSLTSSWTLINIKYRLSDLIARIRDEKSLPPKDNITFLVVAKNEREASYYELSEWQSILIRSLDGFENTETLIEKFKKRYDISMIKATLTRLATLDVIRFKQP